MSLNVSGTFLTESGVSHDLFSGLRDQLKPGWQAMFVPPQPYPQPISPEVINIKQASVVLLDRYLQSKGWTIKGKDVLEIGCNEGIQSYWLALLGAKSVHGVDFPDYGVLQSSSRDQSSTEELDNQTSKLDLARKQTSTHFHPSIVEKVSFSTLDICKGEVQPEKYDVIISWETLEHLNNPQRAFQNMFSTLKQGGFCVHEYNPFFSLIGGHSLCTLDFPFGHCRLSEHDFKKYLREIRPNEYQQALNFYTVLLNRMTMKDLSCYIELAGFNLKELLPRSNYERLNWIDKRVVSEIQSLYPTCELKDLISDFVTVSCSKT